MNKIPEYFGHVWWNSADNLGWKNGYFAYRIHDYFLNNINDVNKFKYPDFHLYDFIRVSINCFTWFGSEMALINGDVGDDEDFLSYTRPKETGRYNIISGSSIVSHFSFNTQRDYLERTDILDRYKIHADKQC